MALRLQTTRLDASKVQRTPAGALRVDATVAAPGVYTYYEPGGKAVREYLPPEEITRADSLASLEDATVTNRHPRNMVDAATWGDVSIGHARSPRAEAGSAVATLVVSRKDAVAGVGKDLIEVSRGVHVRIDETPGVTPAGEAYDRVQRDITYNHIALGPQGWGRQGAAVSLRLDSNGDEQFSESTEPMKYIDPRTKQVYEFKTDSELQIFLDSRQDAFPPKKKDEEEDEDDKKKKAKEDAKLSAEKARADAAEAKLIQIAREALESSARVVLGKDVKFDGKSDRDVRLSVIQKLDSKFDATGKDDTYVSVRFDMALTAQPASSDASDAIAAAANGVRVDGKQTQRTDKDDKPEPQAKMRQDMNEAWKTKGITA